MAVLKSGNTSNNLVVNPTSNSLRVSTYDSLGNVCQPKRTFRATVTNTVAAAAGTAMFFVISGATQRTVIVQRISISCSTEATPEYNSCVIEKWFSQPTGGVAVTLTEVSLDSNSQSQGTAALCQVYTTAPTEGTLVGTVACKRVLVQNSTAVAGSYGNVAEFDFRTTISENTGIYLRGSSECLSASFGATPGGSPTLAIQVEWTEN